MKHLPKGHPPRVQRGCAWLRDTAPVWLWRWRMLLFVVCLAVFLYGEFRPDSPPQLFPHFDKLLHIAAFSGLGLCTALAASGRRFAVLTWPALLVAAPLTEWLQHVLQPATRDFSQGDIAANLAGVVLAYALWRILSRWLDRGKVSEPPASYL